MAVVELNHSVLAIQTQLSILFKYILLMVEELSHMRVGFLRVDI